MTPWGDDLTPDRRGIVRALKRSRESRTMSADQRSSLTVIAV